MFVYALLLSSVFLGAPPEEPDPLQFEISTVPEREIMQYDVLFMRAVVKNTGKEPLVVFAPTTERSNSNFWGPIRV
jgi:hypothetical protein